MNRAAHLRSLGADGLAALLTRRPDVLVGREPRTLAELAQRLDSSASVSRAVRLLGVPQLQVIVAAAALGDGVTVDRLSHLLAGDPLPPLRELEQLDLLALELDVVRFVPGVVEHVPDLLGLGPPFAEIAEVMPHRVLQAAERGLGLRPRASKRDSVAALAAFYGDPELVRHRAEHLQDGLVGALLAHVAGHAAPGFFDEDDEDGFTVEVWEREVMLDRIGLEVGLFIGYEGGYGTRQAFMPSEVALALRGPDYRVRFDPEPPPVAWLPVSRIEADTAAAAADFDAAATAVLDQVAAKPVATVRAGGVGRREVQRLAKATKLDVPIVMLVLEVAAAAGLVESLSTVVVSGQFAAWRDAEPADRFAALALAWWNLPGVPSEDRDMDGNARRVLTRERCDLCRRGRQETLGSLRPDAGLSADDAAAVVHWRSPAAHLGDTPDTGHWRDAARIGAVAQGALTSIGAALVAGDDAALRDAAAAALPSSSTEATFGSDLTAVVVGSPSAGVSALLDACAVRESSGGAVTWRLSPASVRRALDDGRDVAALRTSLTAIAAGGRLPGALEVLLDDVGRVYGRASVRGAAGVVVSDDVALLAQLLHDRKLAKLGLEQVAPTVLVAAESQAVVAETLRSAGYMPAWSAGAAPEPARHVDEAHRAVIRRLGSATATARADPAVLARRLLKAGSRAPATSATERMVGVCCPDLTDDQVAVLAAALDHRERVSIVYESSTGGITERVIRPTDFAPGRIWAWCELRQDDREFVIDRILGVRPV